MQIFEERLSRLEKEALRGLSVSLVDLSDNNLVHPMVCLAPETERGGVSAFPFWLAPQWFAYLMLLSDFGHWKTGGPVEYAKAIRQFVYLSGDRKENVKRRMLERITLRISEKLSWKQFKNLVTLDSAGKPKGT